MDLSFAKRLELLKNDQERLLTCCNKAEPLGNGIFKRYQNPIVTAAHIPICWRYDLNPQTNPYLQERFAINAVFNAGAMLFNGNFVIAARVEGADRKSFFAIAESKNGVDGFRFRDYPVIMPETDEPDTNVYDIRLVQHEDGWIYGLFCTERRDPAAPVADQSMAVAQCGIARTKDLTNWERLPDLKTVSSQQRNVVLHPEFVNGKYAFYTRPQDSFIEAGSGGGIGFGVSDTIEHAVIDTESIIDEKKYHTVYESKNGLGPAPIKTDKGWLHLAHGVRNTAAGLRYVLYLFMTDLHDLTKVIYKPAGYFLAPDGEERIGDVSNVVFSNGWVMDKNETVYIYYASSDTRMHVATASLAQLIDYVMYTGPDGYRSTESVKKIYHIINRNKAFEHAQS